jgi:hypothetical protein
MYLAMHRSLRAIVLVRTDLGVVKRFGVRESSGALLTTDSAVGLSNGACVDLLWDGS